MQTNLIYTYNNPFKELFLMLYLCTETNIKPNYHVIGNGNLLTTLL